jgi:hypothetical protein
MNENIIRFAPDLREALQMGAAEPDPGALPWSVWGSLIWRKAARATTQEIINHVVTIRLRRNDESAFRTLRDGGFLGDSELQLDDANIQREFFLPARDPVGLTHVLLVENEHRRLGSIIVAIEQCSDTFVAYRVSQTVFNTVAVAAGMQCNIPLRWNSILLVRETAARAVYHSCEIVAPVGYPTVTANLSFELPAALARLYSNYVEGFRSNSPFYSFLCFYALAEFVTGTLQGRLRRCANERGIEYHDLNGALTEENVGNAAPMYVGMTYAKLLNVTRPLHNAVAHFIVKRVPRPFNVADEDRAMFARDALKAACRALIGTVEANYTNFVANGMNHDELLRVFEGL